jgi:hypothetical protein
MFLPQKKLGSITMIQSENAKVWSGGTKAHCPLEHFASPPQPTRSWKVFWNFEGVFFVDYLPRGHTIAGEYYEN